MKVGDLIRLLESHGWTHVRTSGSHRTFKHSGHRKLITVAGNRGVDIPAGTLRAILKEAQLEGK